MPRDAQFVKDFVKAVDPTNPIGDAVPVKAVAVTPRQPKSAASSKTTRKTLLKTQAQTKSGAKTKGKAVIKKRNLNRGKTLGFVL